MEDMIMNRQETPRLKLLAKVLQMTNKQAEYWLRQINKSENKQAK
jgi:hypothetical protein